MDAASAEALHRRWADATPLAKFVQDRAQGECPLDSGTGSLEGSSTVERVAASLEYLGSLSSARAAVQAKTQNDLAAGRLVGLGLRSGSQELEEFAFSFWPGAKVDWTHDAMSRGRIRFREIRVEKPEAIASVTAQREPRQGRPSEGELILKAIAHYARTDAGLNERRSKRFRAYRTFISQHGRDPVTHDRLSDKTLEKYETIFRKRNS